LKKKLIITTEIILILSTILPVLALLWDCISNAIHGTYPWGFGYGTDYGEMIYGMDAFIYAFFFDCTFLFVVVALWIGVAVLTIGFTIFTVIYMKTDNVIAE
jgi:hypothetical protein